ncbi:hypothetical protein ACLOJK_027671 [Asimina triloba]
MGWDCRVTRDLRPAQSKAARVDKRSVHHVKSGWAHGNNGLDTLHAWREDTWASQRLHYPAFVHSMSCVRTNGRASVEHDQLGRFAFQLRLITASSTTESVPASAAFGVGIVFAFAYSENLRSRSRSDLYYSNILMDALIQTEDNNVLQWHANQVVEQAYDGVNWHLKYMLRKMEFRNVLQLNWLNLELTKIWPYVNEAASELIRNSVEPVLEQYRPIILSSLKFSKLTLGTVAPQFTVF